MNENALTRRRKLLSLFNTTVCSYSISLLNNTEVGVKTLIYPYILPNHCWNNTSSNSPWSMIKYSCWGWLIYRDDRDLQTTHDEAVSGFFASSSSNFQPVSSTLSSFQCVGPKDNLRGSQNKHKLHSVSLWQITQLM